MKKIVGILGMAAVLASAAFAADPATNFVMSEFKGSAGFGWKAELQEGKDTTFGMYNTAAASLKFGFITAGDKVTTGDGVWGELKISNAASDAAAIPAATVDTAKIHFVDGDFSMALNILKPSIEYAGFTPVTAAPAAAIVSGDAVETFKASREALDKWIKAQDKAIADAEGKLGDYKTEAEYKAAIDAINTKKEEKYDLSTKTTATSSAKPANVLSLDAAKAYLKTMPADKAAPTTTLGTAGLAKDANKKYTAGFGLNVSMKKMFDLNVNFVDNGFINKDDADKKNAAKDKNYALGADLAITAVDGLTAKVAQVTEFTDKVTYFGLQALAGYEIKIDDKLYVKPSAAFETTKAGEAEANNVLAAGVMFGWGAKDVKPAIMDFFQDTDVTKTFNEGVSFAIFPALKGEKANIAMNISMYDQSLFTLLGIEEYGSLKSAFAYDVWVNDKVLKNQVRAAFCYDVTFDPVYINLHAGIDGSFTTAEGVEVKFNPNYKFGVKLGSKTLIDNTDIFAGYELAGQFVENNKPVSNINIGTVISF